MSGNEKLKGEPSDAQVEAAARTLNLNGWTCDEGSDEPGNYDKCGDCRRCCDGLARAVLRAASAVTEQIEYDYGHEYIDEAGTPHAHQVSKADYDAHRPDGHRSDGSPYWNYTPVRRRRAGEWMRDE